MSKATPSSPSAASPLIIETGEVTTLILNRPRQCNALNKALISALQHALTTLAHDNTVKMVVLKGEGTHFCAGADLNDLREMAEQSETDNLQQTNNLASLFHTLHTLPQPTLAWVQGAALGGGAGLVACCDYGIATETAYFGFPEVRLGLIPAIIAPYVSAAIGARRAKSLFMTGETFTADQAKTFGLVHLHTKSGTLLKKTVNALCQTIVANEAHSVQRIKAIMNTQICPIDSKLKQSMSAELVSICTREVVQKK